MKRSIWILLWMFAFVACKKNNNIDSSTAYHDTKGTFIQFSKTDWFTTKESYFSGFMGGNSILGVKLKLIGFTNGDSVKVKAYGDGLISYERVKLDSQNAFNDTVPISFSVTSTVNIPADKFTKSTSLLVFKGTDTLNVTLISGELRYK